MQAREGVLEQLALRIEGMSCGHCVSRVSRALDALPGVSLLQVEVGSARLDFDPAQVDQAAIRQAIAYLGFEAHPGSA